MALAPPMAIATAPAWLPMRKAMFMLQAFCADTLDFDPTTTGIAKVAGGCFITK